MCRDINSDKETTMEHNIVSISGGKDSTATLAVAVVREVDNLQAVFADTGNEHPSDV